MLRSLFAIYDLVAGEVTGPIFSLPNDAAARRVFQDALVGDGSQLAAHPEDYSLFRLGSFDTETGCIEGLPGDPFLNSSPVVSGADVMRKLAERERSDTGPLSSETLGLELGPDLGGSPMRRQVS